MRLIVVIGWLLACLLDIVLLATSLCPGLVLSRMLYYYSLFIPSCMVRLITAAGVLLHSFILTGYWGVDLAILIPMGAVLWYIGEIIHPGRWVILPTVLMCLAFHQYALSTLIYREYSSMPGYAMIIPHFIILISMLYYTKR